MDTLMEQAENPFGPLKRRPFADITACDDDGLYASNATSFGESTDSGYLSDRNLTASKMADMRYSGAPNPFIDSAQYISIQSPEFVPPTRPSTAHSPVVALQCPPTSNTSGKSSRELVFELYQILQEQDEDKDTYGSLFVYEGVNRWAHGSTSSLTTATGSRTSNSPRSFTTSANTSFCSGNKATTCGSKRSSEEEGENEGPSKKKSNDNQDSFAIEPLEQPTYQCQMPCPLLESHDCQGTNTTISELLRSLMQRHRIVICKECCERITIEDEERKPASILQKHAAGCERRCIGIPCGDSSNASVPHHRRTENCPSWASLNKEWRWTFIWTLLNPSSTPPDPVFLPGPAFEHSQEKRPCKQQARVRRNEICTQLMRDIEVKEGRIITLEKELAAARSDNTQLLQRYNERTLNLDKDIQMRKGEIEQVQERCDEKIVNLENIIENLLERLNEDGCFIPGSLQKRLHNECPTVMAEISATFPTSCLQANPQSLPVTASPSWMASSIPNAIFPAPLPPPSLWSTPNISTWRGIASQPEIGPNTRSHYSELYPVTTTSAMDQVNPYTSIWPSYQQQAYPPQHSGYPPQHPDYPSQHLDYPSQHPGYPPQQPGYPLQQQSQSYDEQQQGYAVGDEAVVSEASDNERESTR